MMHSAAEKKSRTGLQICHSIIWSSWALSVCLPFMTCSVNTPTLWWETAESKYGSRKIRATQRSRPLEPVAQGKQDFLRTCIVSLRGSFCGRAQLKLLPSIPFTSGMVMKSGTNPSVKFQVRLSQVLSRCSDYWDGHKPGIVESRIQIWLQCMQECLKIQLNIRVSVSLHRCFKALTKHLSRYDKPKTKYNIKTVLEVPCKCIAR